MARPHDEHPLLYLDAPDAVRAFADTLAGTTEIALDTEGASFHRFVDRVYLLQLSTRSQSAILDPLAVEPPPALGALVADPAVEVVFHDADYDLRLLHQDYGWTARSVFDTRIAAQLLGLRAFGLAALLERYFGLKLDKKHQRADWSQRPLSPDMLDYAAQDTRRLLELRDHLKAELVAKDRLAWAREEFALLEGIRWAVEEVSTAFMKMKGARDLNRRELAVLRELVQWRDSVAGEQDRATFRVMGNEALLELARRQPRDRDALAQVKGVPRGVLEHRHADITDAIARGLAVPEAELPRFPRAARWDRDPDFDERAARLRTVRDAAATRLDLDPGVLCARDRLETVARLNPSTLEELAGIPALRRWQVAVLGEEFLRALHGTGKGRAPTAAAPAAAAAEPQAESASPYSDA